MSTCRMVAVLVPRHFVHKRPKGRISLGDAAGCLGSAPGAPTPVGAPPPTPPGVLFVMSPAHHRCLCMIRHSTVYMKES